MPPQTSKVSSPIAAIVRAHAKDKVDYGQDFSSLPGGIIGGIAELIACETGKYKKGDNSGKPYFMARGTVLRPTVAVQTISKFQGGKVVIVSQQEVSVKGRQTKIGPLPLCQTQTKGNPPKVTTVEDAYVNVINELKKLGGEECTASLAELPENATEAQVLAAIDVIGKALVDARVRFKFNTRDKVPTADWPNGGTWPEEWKGAEGVEDIMTNAGSAVVDETAMEESTGQEETAPESSDADEQQSAETVEEDLAELVTAADAGDKSAQQRLIELAVEAGADKDDAEGKETWQEVADLIGGEEVEAPEEEAEPEPWKPVVGEEYEYAPPVKNKAGKWVAGTKTVKCDVTTVDEAKETVTLQARDKAKTAYKGVKWSAIAPQE